MASSSEARIFVVGKTGSGKSSTGNSLLGESLFSVGLDFGSVSTKCHVHQRQRFGMNIKVTDSPGLFDTNKTQEEIATILMHGVTAMHPGPDVILYVTKVGRYTEEEHGAYERLKALLDTNFTNHMIVVFSHGDLLKGHDISVMLKSAPKELKQVLTDCSNRYVVIDNTATNNLAQVQELIKAIAALRQKNGGRPYACPKYAQVGQKLDEECAKRMQDLAKREASRKKYVKDLNAQLQEVERERREMEERERERKELERRRRREREEAQRKQERAIRDLEVQMARLQATVDAKPFYRSVICRHVRVWHDVGVLSYCTSSSSTPVAQFIGPNPLNPNCNSFSLEIVNEGRDRCISIGLCPSNYKANRQPGWNSPSVGYHADDGGIFIDNGYPDFRVEECYKGDIMVCELDFQTKKAFFYKNYELMTTVGLVIPTGGYHPAVGMHSPGESVRLLQREPWQ